MFTTKINVNGKEYPTKEHKVWMDAFMYGTDVQNVLRTQPSFSSPETTLDIKIYKDDQIVATFSKLVGWKFVG